MVSGRVTGIGELCAREKCTVRQVNITISLALLAPNLVQAAVEGRLPRDIGVERLRDPPTPVIKPGLRLRRERKFPLQRQAGKSRPRRYRDQPKDAVEARTLRFLRAICGITCEGLHPWTGWWAHQGSNLGPDD